MAFQRDRDRIIHSTAFRRLEYKTQVFVNHEGDYYRTRLTHTVEAAQVTRTVARMLGLNEDLAETVALAHDLGHTPFGHAGERTLDRLMASYGGFDHNSQSLRIAHVGLVRSWTAINIGKPTVVGRTDLQQWRRLRGNWQRLGTVATVEWRTSKDVGGPGSW
jgi:predicted deoxyguanosinetriphosphate triphosphohydrolase